MRVSFEVQNGEIVIEATPEGVVHGYLSLSANHDSDANRPFRLAVEEARAIAAGLVEGARYLCETGRDTLGLRRHGSAE